MTTAAVIGTGYVGLVTAACFAELGHDVTGVDVRPELVAALQRGELPIHETGLAPLLESGLASGRLRFTTSYAQALERTAIVFLCVDTPMSATGAADTSRLDAAAASLAEAAAGRSLVVVVKSTAPVGTARRLAAFFDEHAGPGRLTVVSNPEFLQQGNSVHDFLHPSRVLLGTRDGVEDPAVANLFRPFGAPLVCVNWETAEISKYASNAFLATKISFINEIAALCDAVGADVTRVADAMGLDPRIGRAFLNAGAGYGGSCLPKDVAALVHTARENGVEPELLPSVAAVNQQQWPRIEARVEAALDGLHGKRIALLGLAFKPSTDDLRSAPSLVAIAGLLAAGAEVVAFDPVVKQLPEPAGRASTAPDAYEAARNADALVLITEWPEFRALDWRRIAATMRGRTIFDARNALTAGELEGTGLQRMAVGIPDATPLATATPASPNT